MNIPQQILTIILGLTLLSPTLAAAETSWHLVATDDSGNQWYLGEVERIHFPHDNHHAAYVKGISPDGNATEIRLGIDCQDGTVINRKYLELYAPDLLQHLTDESTFAQAMANAICKDR
jgi:hypothetical protein